MTRVFHQAVHSESCCLRGFRASEERRKALGGGGLGFAVDAMAGHSSAEGMLDASVAGGGEASARLPFAVDDEGLGEEGVANEGQPHVVVSFGAPFSILDASDDWCEMVGFAKAKIVGRTLRMLQGPRTNVGSLKEIVHSCQQGITATGIITFYSQSGNELLCAVTARVHPFDNAEKEDACRLTMCKTEASIFCMASFSSERTPQVVISLPAQEVLNVNPAFHRRFTTVKSVIGKNISELHSAKSADAWKRMVHACCSGVSVRLSMVVNELASAEFECMVRAVPRLADDSSEVHRILLTYEVEPTECGPGFDLSESDRSKTFSGDELLNLGKTKAEMEEIEFLQIIARTPSMKLSKSQPDWMNSPMMGIARERTERKMASHLSKLQSIMGNPPPAGSSIAGSFSNKVSTTTIELGLGKRVSTNHSQSGGREQARAGLSPENGEPMKSGMDRTRSMSANTSPNLVSTSCSEAVAALNGSSNAGIESKDKAQRAMMKTDRGLQRHLQLMASRRPSATSSFSSAKATSPCTSTDSNSRSVDSREGSAAGSGTSGSSGHSTLHSQKDDSLRNAIEPSLNQKVMTVMNDASLNGSQRHEMIQELRRQHADGKASKVHDFTAPSHATSASRDAALTVPESVAEEGDCTPLSAIFPSKNRTRGGQDIVNLTSPDRNAVVPSVEDEMKAAACEPLDEMLGDRGDDGSQWQGVRSPGSHLVEAGMEDKSLCHWRGMGKVETLGSTNNKIQCDISDANVDKSGGDHEGLQQALENLLRARDSPFDKPKHDADGVSSNVTRDEAKAISCDSRAASNESVFSNSSSESRGKAEKAMHMMKSQRRREEMHVDAAIERCGGDKEGVYQMAMQFLQDDFPSKVASLRQAVEMGDSQAATEIAASMIDLAEAIGAVSLLERLEPLASVKSAAARSQGSTSRSQSFDNKVDLIDVEIERVGRFWRNFDPT